MVQKCLLLALMALGVSCAPSYRKNHHAVTDYSNRHTMNAFDAITGDMLQKVKAAIDHAPAAQPVPVMHTLDALNQQYTKTRDSYLSWRGREANPNHDSEALGHLNANSATLMSTLAAYYAVGGQ
jgi:hypothetical protein